MSNATEITDHRDRLARHKLVAAERTEDALDRACEALHEAVKAAGERLMDADGELRWETDTMQAVIFARRATEDALGKAMRLSETDQLDVKEDAA